MKNTQMIRITTNQLKKNRLDSKEVEAQVIFLPHMVIVCLDKRKQLLDKCQHLELQPGIQLLVDGQEYVCIYVDVLDSPGHYVLQGQLLAA